MRHHSYRHLYLLAILLSLTTCCFGQRKISPPQTSTTTGYPKLMTTQGKGPYTTVRCGLQDRAGNMWFCTTGEGIYRYDGMNFTCYTEQDGLSSNVVWSVMEDRAGNVWFGTSKGATRWDGKTMTRVPIPAGSDKNPSRRNEVWSMMQDRGGRLWFGTSEGVYSCPAGNTAFTPLLSDGRVANPDGLQLKQVETIYEDKDGIIWFGSGMVATEGVGRFDGKRLTVMRPYGDGWIRTITEDKDGHLCFATRHHGVCRLDDNGFTNITEKAGIGNADLSGIMTDKAGNLWIATESGSGGMGEDGGLWRYDGKVFTKFTTKDGLPHNAVWGLVEDRTGHIWVGTRNTGLCRYDGKTFTRFSE